MPQPQPQWQVLPTPEVPQWFREALQRHLPSGSDGGYAAQLLWQRGIQNSEQLSAFLNPDDYQPAGSSEFGEEMHWAVQRLQKAREAGEKVAIWGDFDADGITATSVLWEGLGEFFEQHQQLTYYIPNRFSESHGINQAGIEKLRLWGTQLIVTCDTGSTNQSEIAYAQQLGMDVIVTDHHTLLPERPSVVAIINPRYLGRHHPLFHLSGVAVAYKLTEALYQALPEVPQQPVESLLDLVAMGLIADLVELSGDCRYLAQRGIQQLQRQTRPGLAYLLSFCQRQGDRPTDISFGLGPRINAVSRIHGDASFCVELLTSRDSQRCKQLASDADLANTRRKSLQKDVVSSVKKKLAQIDLSTTWAIILEDPQWQSGVLGLVAGQIAEEYGLPTILLTADSEGENGRVGEAGKAGEAGEAGEETFNLQPATCNLHSSLFTPHSPSLHFARGSARSVQGIDLYQLVQSQAHLLHRFGGHPFAAGLSLPVENIPLFAEAMNQQLRQYGGEFGKPTIEADLIVTVAELGQELFRELKLLEPCGMGNPVPKLLIQNCWFREVWHKNTKDWKGRKVQYIKTTFQIWDDSSNEGFPGMWWGHYKEELPQDQPCDAIVELDFNSRNQGHYEVRLIAVKPSAEATHFSSSLERKDWLLDWRGAEEAGTRECGDTRSRGANHHTHLLRTWAPPHLGTSAQNTSSLLTPHSSLSTETPIQMRECPLSWDEVQVQFREAVAQQRQLALAYSPPSSLSPEQIWQQLVGVAKYLNRTGVGTTRAQLREKLGLGDRSLSLGLEALSELGFAVQPSDHTLQVRWHGNTSSQVEDTITSFLAAVAEEQFRCQYFYQVPLSTLQGRISQTALD